MLFFCNYGWINSIYLKLLQINVQAAILLYSQLPSYFSQCFKVNAIDEDSDHQQYAEADTQSHNFRAGKGVIIGVHDYDVQKKHNGHSYGGRNGKYFAALVFDFL